jgi:hypothetical protein
MTHTWYEPYKAAILETDWTKILGRIQSAEFAIQERQRILSLDHGGSPEETQAIADALRGIGHLRTKVTDWEKRQISRKRQYYLKTD